LPKKPIELQSVFINFWRLKEQRVLCGLH
jgi:hypothetical protein